MEKEDLQLGKSPATNFWFVDGINKNQRRKNVKVNDNEMIDAVRKTQRAIYNCIKQILKYI